jgi:uncharacterized protein YukE
MGLPSSFRVHINGDASPLDALADQLDRMSPTFDLIIKALNQIGEDSDFWSGDGANACRSGLAKMEPHVKRMGPECTAQAKAIRKLATKMRAAQKASDQIYDDLLHEQATEADMWARYKDKVVPEPPFLHLDGDTAELPAAYPQARDISEVDFSNAAEVRDYVRGVNANSAQNAYSAAYSARMGWIQKLLEDAGELIDGAAEVESNTIPLIGATAELAGESGELLGSHFSKAVLEAFGSKLGPAGEAVGIVQSVRDAAHAKSIKTLTRIVAELAIPFAASKLAGRAATVASGDPAVGAAVGTAVGAATAAGEVVKDLATRVDWDQESSQWESSVGLNHDGAPSAPAQRLVVRGGHY